MATQADYKRMGNWAVMKNPDANIDRHTCTRVIPMQVLVLSYPRTGTLSMWEALEILGYHTYHYSSIFENVQDADMWQEAFRAKFQGKGTFGKADFDRLLGHVSAVTDVPSICFWRELLEFYPKAKVILVERDEYKWMKSMEVLLEGVLNPVGRYVIRFTDPWWHGRIVGCGMAWIEACFGSTDIETARRNARAAYRKHYREVREALEGQKGRLLEYELGSGWTPVCDFLGKPVPSVEFPKKNDAKSFELALGAFLGKALENSLRNVSVVVGATALAIGIWRSRFLRG